MADSIESSTLKYNHNKSTTLCNRSFKGWYEGTLPGTRGIEIKSTEWPFFAASSHLHQSCTYCPQPGPAHQPGPQLASELTQLTWAAPPGVLWNGCQREWIIPSSCNPSPHTKRMVGPPPHFADQLKRKKTYEYDAWIAHCACVLHGCSCHLMCQGCTCSSASGEGRNGSKEIIIREIREDLLETLLR